MKCQIFSFPQKRLKQNKTKQNLHKVKAQSELQKLAQRRIYIQWLAHDFNRIMHFVVTNTRKKKLAAVTSTFV